MHATSMSEMARLLGRWPAPDADVLDVGSMDVNGSYRALIEGRGWRYTGLDIAPGANVDVAADDPAGADLAGAVDVGAATGLRIESDDLDDPDSAGRHGWFDVEGSDEFGAGAILGFGDDVGADRQIPREDGVHRVLELRQPVPVEPG